MEATVQKLEKTTRDNIHLAQQYYGILSSLNSLGLTEREIQLISYTAVRGSISFGTVREDFCKKYNSTFPTINNMVSKLKRMSIFVKEGKQIVVNPRISLDFSKPLILQITLTINKPQDGETSKHAPERVLREEVESENQHV
jgi:hypothetical protein